MKHTYGFMIGLCAMTLLGAGCLGFGQDRADVSDRVPERSQERPQQSPEQEEEQEEKAEEVVWKTYTNTDMGFTVEYRDGMMLTDGGTFVSIGFWGPTQREGTELYDGIGFSVGSLEIADGWTFEQAAEADFEAGGYEIAEPLHAVSYDHADGFEGSLIGMGEFTYVYLPGPTANTMFRISVVVRDPGGLGFEEAVEHMLNSFEAI